MSNGGDVTMEKEVKKSRFSIRQLTVVGLLAGITFVLGLTGWGFIPIPPINATILHVPTILGAIVEGPKVGLFVGLLFGGYSLMQSILAPNIMSFALINPLVSVLPRMLIGPMAYLAYRLLPIKNQAIRIGTGAFVGSATNTILVMFLIYALYGKEYAAIKKISESDVIGVIMGVVLSHGVPEALLAVAVVTPIALVLKAKTQKVKSSTPKE